MRNIQRLAAEVREEIGLIGPVDAKVLARCLGICLLPMPYPCEGLLEDEGSAFAAYHALGGETAAQAQIARAVCAYLLTAAGIDWPREADVQCLAALLCGPTALVAA
jgi:hypothetical protein